MSVHSRVREIAAIVAVAAALVGAQLGAHVFFSFDEAPDLWDGGILKPGMAEATARAMLDERYELVKAGGEKYDLRVKAGVPLGPGGGISSQRTEGAAWFHGGKLARLSHDVYRADAGLGDAADFAGAVQAAIAVTTDFHKGRSCEVSTEMRKSSSTEVTETDISCGRRTVRILMSSAPGARTARLQVSEEIQ
jgi:hypothetical protein